MGNKIRSSKQLFIDDNLNVNNKKITNLADAVADSDAVNKGQMNTAIGTLVSGVGGALHVPVADLAAIIALTDAVDKMLCLVENLGLYRYDAESTATSNNGTTATVIRPTNVTSDAFSGRWIKISNILTSHALLDAILGNGEYHLSLAERDKLTGIEANADVTDKENVGSAINSATAKTTPVDADMIGIVDSAASNVLKKFTFGNLKTWVSAFFSGDITVTSGGVSSIGANKVTNAQLAQIATQTFKGRTTAGTGNVEDLTIAQVKTLLGLNTNNQLTRKYRVVPTGVVNNSNVIFTIADLIVSGTEEVFKNGLLMNAGAGNDYTISYGATTTITFLEAPNNTGYSDVILVNYSIA